MLKILLITIIFLFQSFASFASVDSKGIVCRCLECILDHLDPSSLIINDKPSEIGFHFKINKVAIYYITKIGDKIKVSENIQTTLRKKKRFYITEDEINWTYKDSRNIYAYTLDRKTLILRQKNITKTQTYNIRKCEAFSEINFFKNMDKLSKIYQKNYYIKPKKNKI